MTSCLCWSERSKVGEGVRGWGRAVELERKRNLWLSGESQGTLCIWAVLVAPQVLRILQEQKHQWGGRMDSSQPNQG